MDHSFCKRLRAGLALALVLLLCLTGCTAAPKAPDAASSGATTNDGPGDQTADQGSDDPILPAFNTQTLDGEAADESLFDGYQVIMLNFWATFCGPCIREMPALGELADEYADKGVLIVGVPTDLVGQDGQVVDSLLASALEIRSTTGADYPHLFPSVDMQPLLQQIYAVPTTVFLDSEGRQLGEGYVGAKEKEDWAALLDSFLAEVAA